MLINIVSINLTINLFVTLIQVYNYVIVADCIRRVIWICTGLSLFKI